MAYQKDYSHLIGLKKLNLKVLKVIRKNKRAYLVCQCICGKKAIRAVYIFVRNVKNNGCDFCCKSLRVLPKSKIKTGRKPRYHANALYNIIQRCYNKNHKNYKWYGERGITVCDRWQNSLANFISDIGERPAPGYSVDRINNDGNYEPDNCKWSTAKEQANNRRCVKLK